MYTSWIVTSARRLVILLRFEIDEVDVCIPGMTEFPDQVSHARAPLVAMRSSEHLPEDPSGRGTTADNELGSLQPRDEMKKPKGKVLKTRALRTTTRGRLRQLVNTSSAI